MLVRLNQFMGLMPRLDPHLLPNTAAVIAQNCKMVSGNLKPWKNILTVATPTKVGTKQSIFLYDSQYWLTWTQDVDAVTGPLANDTYKRIYWTGEGVPKMSTHDLIVNGGTDYPNASLNLGIPAPVHAPTTTPGPDWTENTGLPSSGVWVVGFGNGIFVALKRGTSEAAYSSDGITWTATTLPSSGSSLHWYAVSYGAGVFVGVARYRSSVITSPDGITWTDRVLPSTNDWSGVAFSGSLFVVVAFRDTVIETSPDGITWTERTLTAGKPAGCITYGNGLFLVPPYDGSDSAQTSPDGITWTVRTLPNGVWSNAASFGNGTFVISSYYLNIVLTSPDGITWTVRTLPAALEWDSIAFGLNTFVMLPRTGVDGLTSLDNGVTWQVSKVASATHWNSIAFGNSIFVTVPTSSDAVGLLSDISPLAFESRAYVYRYVSTYGEVGPPSPASSPYVDARPGQTVILSGIDVAPAGNYSIATIEIYRTNTGSTATDYQYVDSIAIGTTTYSDTVTNADLGEVLDSDLWDPPPADLTGLIALPNGSLCGYSGKQLCFSVPYQPHAWPVNQRYPLADTIKGIKAYGMNVLAAAAGPPYVATIGNDLTSLLPQRLESGYACVSKRGMVDMGYAVSYPEPGGLRMAGVNGVDLVTTKALDKDSWQALHPSTISAYYYGGAYVAFTDLGCFILDLDGNLVNVTNTTATAGFHDPSSGNLYLAVGSNIAQWDAGATNMTYVWQSKPFQAVRPINMSCGQVFANAYPVIFKLYADGVLKSTKTVTDAKPFRLPKGYRAKEFAVRLEGSQNIYDVFLAESMAELRAA